MEQDVAGLISADLEVGIPTDPIARESKRILTNELCSFLR